jgi:hypothetical protein
VTAPDRDRDRDFRSSVRNISYDYRNGRGVLLLDEGCGCIVALFAAIDPQVRFAKVIAGRRACASYERLERHWVAYR